MLAQCQPDNYAPSFVILTGRGRSGTTWIGRVLAAYPDASYHNETFLLHKQNAYLEWLKRLQAGDPTANRDALMALCARPRLDVDLPPYNKKTFRRYPNWLIWSAYQMAKRVPLFGAAFRHAASERRAPSARVLKEVNLPNETLERLCATTRCHLIPIIRAPFDSICSALRGYRSGRFGPIDARARQHAANILERTSITTSITAEQVMSLGEAAFEALRWRIQTEPLVEFAESYAHSHIINYDDFRDDPEHHARGLYSYLGWEINALAISNARGEAQRYRQRDHYYSTDASSVQRRGSHRDYLTAEELRECQKVLSPSPLLGRWDQALG